jgi:hypothetical protein
MGLHPMLGLAELHAMRTGHAAHPTARSPETGTGLYL